jgi:hypothetical protein
MVPLAHVEPQVPGEVAAHTLKPTIAELVFHHPPEIRLLEMPAAAMLTFPRICALALADGL